MADQLLREVDVLASDVNRNYVPGHKMRGSVSLSALLSQTCRSGESTIATEALLKNAG